MSEPAATSDTLIQQSDRVYSIERFYSLVAGASEDRISVALREDLRNDALSAAYTVEAWLEEIKGREEKYDRLANLARSVAPISDLLRTFSSGVFTGCYIDLLRAYEEKSVRSFLAQRYELRQSASEVEDGEQLPLEEDLLTALQSIVSQPDGRDDYVAWFQIGWLEWKRGILDEAETAFRTAASFSQRHSQWYFAQSLRHEAYMQWKRRNVERSRGTIRRALDIRRDPSMLVEAARYAAACGQTLESQSLIDEALHADPLIFVSVLADPAFATSVTSTMDILVRQQTRSADNARSERNRWQEAITTIRTAEEQSGLKLLPENSDAVYAAAELTAELDYPTAIYRAEQAKSLRSEWVKSALETLRSDVSAKKNDVDHASEALRTAKIEFNKHLDDADSEQRLAEIAVQEQHNAVKLPVVPSVKEEMTHGLVIGLFVLAIGLAILAGLCQWKFGSIPPLQPVPTFDLVLISPLLAVMALFGVFGALTFPAIRISKANREYIIAASAADSRAEQQLRVLAGEGTRKRDQIKHDWAGKEMELHANITEAQRKFRSVSQALSIVKQLPL